MSRKTGRSILYSILGILMLLSLFATGQQAGAQAGGSNELGPNLTIVSADKGNPKLDSRLNQLLASANSSGQMSVFAEQAQIPLARGRVRVIIESAPGSAPESLATVKALGTVEASHGDLIQMLVPVPALVRLANSPVVRFVRLPLAAVPDLVVSQGVALTGADAWHNADYSGAGVKVAVLDTGFAGYTARQTEGELPANLVTRWFRSDNTSGTSPHGTACAEIVYDMAPGAQLYLVDFGTEVEFADAIDWLVSEHVNVVSSSVAWPAAGPGDGTGPIDDLVAPVRAAGILWSQSAGNYAERYWRGNFVDTNGNGWNDFFGGDEGQTLAVQSGQVITAWLTWNDPWGSSSNDYDLLLCDNTNHIVAASTNSQSGTGDPYEGLAYQATYSGTYWIGIGKRSGAAIRQLQLFSGDYDLQYQVVAGSLAIPADSPDVMTVGAVPWNTPTTLEQFSSQGPTADGRTKPDLVAPDGVSTATYGPVNGPDTGFFGTSAAAPHAAGAAALVKQLYADYTPAQVQAYLENSATDLGGGGKDNLFGSGRIVMPIAADVAVIDVNCTVTDGVLSRDGRYAFLSSKTDRKLYIVDLETGDIQSISFTLIPESIAISPQGNAVYLALLVQDHPYSPSPPVNQGYIAEIDPASRSVVRQFEITEDPYDMVVTSNGYLYASSGSGQWSTIKGYNIATGQEVGSVGNIYEKMHIALTPSEDYLFGAENPGLSPNKIMRFAVSQGNIQSLGYYPYHGQHDAGGDLAISPEGKKIFSKSGAVFESENMTYVATLGRTWSSVAFEGTTSVLSIDLQTMTWGYDSSVRRWNADNYSQAWAVKLRGDGRLVFRRSTDIVAITEGGDYPSTSRIYIFTRGVRPGVATDAATNESTHAATLNGSLSSLGSAASATVSFEWGLTTAYGNTTANQTMTGTGPFSASTTGLAPYTTCHFRAKAVGDGTSYGADKTFTTLFTPLRSQPVGPRRPSTPR